MQPAAPGMVRASWAKQFIKLRDFDENVKSNVGAPVSLLAPLIQPSQSRFRAPRRVILCAEPAVISGAEQRGNDIAKPNHAGTGFMPTRGIGELDVAYHR